MENNPTRAPGSAEMSLYSSPLRYNKQLQAGKDSIPSLAYERVST